MARLLAALALAAFVPGLAQGADAPKPTAEALAGNWKMSKSASPLPPGATAVLAITADGKFTMVLDFMGKKTEIPGTWALDGAKLATVMKGPAGQEKKETLEITTLTADELVTKDEKGMVDEFKKVKAETK